MHPCHGVLLIYAVAVFLTDPREEFNLRIDAPVEKEHELYSHHE